MPTNDIFPLTRPKIQLRRLRLDALAAAVLLFLVGTAWAQHDGAPPKEKGPLGRMQRQPGATEADSQKRRMGATMMRAKRDFEHIDENQDGKISPEEWMRRGNFDNLDADADGYLVFEEMAALYRPKQRLGKVNNPIGPSTPPEMDASFESDRVQPSALSGSNLCGIDRDVCKSGHSLASQRGLLPTGLGPRFPASAECLGIDDYYAMSYDFKRSNSAVAHGGLDIPAPWDTPVLAAAAGTVVGRFQGQDTQRGVEVILRHSPEDTGLPFWVYTQYAHLAALPEQALGQRVRMGEIIGLTSNTGLDSKNQTSDHRRPALHFVAWFSPSRQFASTSSAIVPVDGQWMDPHILYRGKPPFESVKAEALPDADKWVDIPVMYVNGATEPADTRLIWPYTCIKRR